MAWKASLQLSSILIKINNFFFHNLVNLISVTILCVFNILNIHGVNFVVSVNWLSWSMLHVIIFVYLLVGSNTY